MSDSPRRIVFVCTGNTCRSPLAKALCEMLLAKQLNCDVKDLPERGYIVQSAGLAAFPGCEASRDAITVAQELGASLEGHESRTLTMEHLTESDYIFAMTTGHLDVLRALRTDVGAEPRLLADSGEDIADPLGSEPEVYRTCALQILAHLERIVPELLRR